MSNKFILLCLVSFFCLGGCTRAQTPAQISDAAPPETPAPTVQKIQNPGRVIHVLVALCDNEHQGIVPVPAALGNGEDPAKNLYWGAAYGVKTFFSKSTGWQRIAAVPNPQNDILERVIFKHQTGNAYLVADAYRGSRMKETIDDFLAAASGARRENVMVDNLTLQILGGADLVAFVGHDGLMDFSLEKEYPKKDDAGRDAVILACASRNYFNKPLQKTGANPLLWTSNLVAPEAYILHDALEGWLKNEPAGQIRVRAAAAYSKYQKISLRSAQNLLVTGW